MDYDSYDSTSEIAYSDDSDDTGDYGFDGGADQQPRARQVRACPIGMAMRPARSVALRNVWLSAG